MFPTLLNNLEKFSVVAVSNSLSPAVSHPLLTESSVPEVQEGGSYPQSTIAL